MAIRPIAGQHIYRTTDFIHWTPLPPIPVKGTSVQRSGVYQTLGMTADGRLLALGADPAAGFLRLPKTNNNGRVSGPPPALWAWNIRSGRWDVASTHVPCKDLQTCYVYSTGRYRRHRGKRQGGWNLVLDQRNGQH